jgi:Mannosyltransferase putative
MMQTVCEQFWPKFGDSVCLASRAAGRQGLPFKDNVYCRECWKAATDARDEQIAKKIECVHLGGLKGCQNPRPCDLLNKAVTIGRDCLACHEYRIEPNEPKVILGLLDPIQDPELEYTPQKWADWAPVRLRHIESLRQWAEYDHKPPVSLSGSGIVICGGGRYWAGAVIAARMIRKFSMLPIQIWHRGQDEPVNLRDIEGFENLAIVDASKLERPRVLRGWECKSFALVRCGFERVLLLDADAYPVGDFTPMLAKLDSAPFVFWSDFPANADKVKWDAYGLPSQDSPPIIGGHLAINLRTFWKTVAVAYWIDQHSDYFYRHQYGDQDSWRVALALTGAESLHLGPANWEHPAFVCRLDGQPLFVHRCKGKLMVPQFRHQEQSKAPATHLPMEREVWDHLHNLLASGQRSAEETFGDVYRSGEWAPNQRSGKGSTEKEARPYLHLINSLIQVSGWKTIVDLGSGDGWITSRIAAANVIGVDCHRPHIQTLDKTNPDVWWLHLDLDTDRDILPDGDMCLVKDVFQHWPNEMVREWLDWAILKRKWKWLLVTNDRNQAGGDGEDTWLGGYRGLNPSFAPLKEFGFQLVAEYLHKAVLLKKL